MNKKKLNKLKRKLASLRNRPANIRSPELISLATQLGRKLSDRGKEPTYVSSLLKYSRPISIPNHPGSLPRYTAGSILDDLEEDIAKIEEKLDETGELNE